MTRAALGFRAHSGWAAVVAVAESARAIEVIDRRRIELVSAGNPGQPYHAAEKLVLKKAEVLIAQSIEEARQLAVRAMKMTLDELREKGYQVSVCGILLGSGRPQTSIEATLRSHALIHTAEGDLFRGALTFAAGSCGLSVVAVKEREVLGLGEARLGIRGDALRRRLTEMGKAVGPPWRQDEKLAALAAWLGLEQG